MIYFDDVDISIKPKGAANATGVLAQSCSLNISNNAREIYSIGRRGVGAVSPDGPAVASLDISYLLESENEPFFEIVRLLKQHNRDKTRIVFAGITGDFYLKGYTLQASPNSLIKANASFECFDFISGESSHRFRRKGETASLTYNESKSITHGWTTYLIESGNHPKKNPTLNLSYSFEAVHIPSYAIGKQAPTQVDFMAGREKIKATKLDFYNAHVSGITGQDTNVANSGSFSGDAVFAPYLLSCRNDKPDQSLEISMSGAVITSSEVSVDVNGFPTTNITADKYF